MSTLIGKDDLTGKILAICKLIQSVVAYRALLLTVPNASRSYCFIIILTLFFLVAIGRTFHAMIILTVIQALGFALVMAGVYLTVNGKCHVYLES